MDVLEFGLAETEPDGRRDEHMVELLRVLVKDITVTLNLGDASNRVDVGEEGGERFVYRASLNELVEVSSNNDVSQGVFL